MTRLKLRFLLYCVLLILATAVVAHGAGTASIALAAVLAAGAALMAPLSPP